MEVPPLRDRDLMAQSKRIEQVLEYRFLAELTGELLKRARDFDVLRGEVDCHGHDIVVEVEGVFRHIQLKATVLRGRRARVTLNTALAKKPSGCVVWMTYDPEKLSLVRFRFFGGKPGHPLPLDEKAAIAKHVRPNASGAKAERANHRILTRQSFQAVESIEAIVDLLFGPEEIGSVAPL